MLIMRVFGLAWILLIAAPRLAAAQWVLLAPPPDSVTTSDYAEAIKNEAAPESPNSRIGKLMAELKHIKNNDDRRADMIAKYSYRADAPMETWQPVDTFASPEECNLFRITAMKEAGQRRRDAMNDATALGLFLGLKRIVAGACLPASTAKAH